MALRDDSKKPDINIPPIMRDNELDGKSGMNGGFNARRNDDTTTIRISNLSLNTSEVDLEDLVKPFGPISKRHLSRDKTSGLCKGFAFVHFKNKADAAIAIQNLNGFEYENSILAADFSATHQMAKKKPDKNSICISNLPLDTSEVDLEDLVKPFGPISKRYLSKDKTSGLCKGFAYAHYRNKADAVTAIQNLNGFEYDHLILAADWSKPQNQDIHFSS